MAPEVARGLPALDASDQYSLGATLWHMLTGRPLFPDRVVEDLLRQHIHSLPPDLAQLRPDLPSELVETLHITLAKDPGQRFADCDVLARRLRAHAAALTPVESASDGAVPGPAAGSAYPGRLPRGGHPIPPGLADRRPRGRRAGAVGGRPHLVASLASEERRSGFPRRGDPGSVQARRQVHARRRFRVLAYLKYNIARSA